MILNVVLAFGGIAVAVGALFLFSTPPMDRKPSRRGRHRPKGLLRRMADRLARRHTVI